MKWAMFGKGRVLLSRIIFGSEIIEPGRVRVTVCADDVVIGDPAGVVEEDFLRELAKTFTLAGIPTRYEPDVYRYLWDKLIYNCALNPLGALLETNYGSLAQNPNTRDIMDRIIEEIFEVAGACGMESSWKTATDFKKVFYDKLVPSTSTHYPSMLRDIKRGRTEIDALNGAVCELARKHGVHVPTNELITKLVKAKESIFKLRG